MLLISKERTREKVISMLYSKAKEQERDVCSQSPQFTPNDGCDWLIPAQRSRRIIAAVAGEP
jgi:hypothetical protein